MTKTEEGGGSDQESVAESAARDGLEGVNPEVFAPEGAEREPVFVEAPPKEPRRFTLLQNGAVVRARLKDAAVRARDLVHMAVREWAKRILLKVAAVLLVAAGVALVREGILRVALWRAAPSPEVVSETTERAPSAPEEAPLLVAEHRSLAPVATRRETLLLTEVTKEAILRSRFEVAATPLPAGSVREVVFEAPSGATLAIGGYLANLVGDGDGAITRLLDPDATILIYYHADAVSTGFVAKVRPLAEEEAVEAALVALAESPNVGNLYLVDPGEKRRVVTGPEAGGAVVQAYFSKTKHVATLEIISRGSDRYVILGTSPNVTESLRAMANGR